ncbi:MAG: hypothetical protein ACK4N5_18660 [Myxococcales bacterium]
MNCRILSAALLLSVAPACGPESEEAGDLALIQAQTAGVTTVAASQDPIPARPPGVTPVAASAVVLVPVLAGDTIAVVPAVVNPVDPRSASQDPIPARSPLGQMPSETAPAAPRAPNDPRL